jgi:hypothetical protein
MEMLSPTRCLSAVVIHGHFSPLLRSALAPTFTGERGRTVSWVGFELNPNV